jgi:HAE1 family hydrophobic/amphiphilic exporter-1
MIESLINGITRASLRYKWVTIGLAVLVSVGGIWAVFLLNQELLPKIEFPQSVVLAFNQGTETDTMLDEVTLPIEEAVTEIEGVVNVESTTSPGVSVIVVRNEFGLDQEKLRDEIQVALESLRFPEGMEPPELLTFSLSDLPIASLSVSSPELSLSELKEFVEAKVVPALEAVPDVADVKVTGGQELPEAIDATEDVTTTEETAPVVDEEPEDPSRLPSIFIEGAKALGLEVENAQELTPELLAEATTAGPISAEQLLTMLQLIPPETLPFLPPETIALLPVEYVSVLDSELQSQLDELAAEVGGAGQYTLAELITIFTREEDGETESAEPEPTEEAAPADTQGAGEITELEPVSLPEAWVQAASAQGLSLETTADLSPEIVGGIASFAPELLQELTPEMLLAMPQDSLAALPQEYLAGLDPELQASLAERMAGPAAQEIDIEPVALPDSWLQAAAQLGQEFTTTADITPVIMTAIVDFAPQLLADLQPAMWRAIDPEAVAVALPVVSDDLDASLLVQLQAIQLASAGENPEPIALPDSWLQAASAFGFTLESTADVPPEALGLLAANAPQLLEDLTEEHILAFTPEVQAALPEDFITGLDDGLQETLVIISLFQALPPATEPEAETEPEPEPTATPDPARLPDLLIQGAQTFGLEIELASDIQPEFMRQIGALGPQGLQVLQLLTEDNLRLLQPEVIALLPVVFLDTLEADLRSELDGLAADYGGAGQLAIDEAEAAAELSADAPELSELWRAPAEDGSESVFQTAADLINSGFAPTAAEFLNFFVSSGRPTGPPLMGDLTPEVIFWVAENEENFLQNLNPAVLRLFSPEMLSALPEEFINSLDPELQAELRGIAAGTITAFIPEATITRVDGNPSLNLQIFKDGEANTVSVSEEVFIALDELEATYPDLSIDIVFEQASFIKESVQGVAREGILGAIFAVVVILLFLSGRNREGHFKWSWRSTLVIAVSIPLSVLMAFVMLKWVPTTVSPLLGGLADATAGIPVLGALTLAISRLFPTDISLNLMTLSGITVAIGRVVDDSIVVLENIYRHLQRGDDQKEAVLTGTRDVAIAILASTVTTVIVFLPIGLLGGVVGEFFLPFGMTVTYALAASFLVAVTIVPLLAYLFIRKEDLPSDKETGMQKRYTPILRWVLAHRLVTLIIATLLFLGSMFLMTTLPRAFLPELGEVQVTATVSLPGDVTMADTNDQVILFEDALAEIDGLGIVLSEIGSAGGFAALFLGETINQNAASILIGIEDPDQVDQLVASVREEANDIFGEGNAIVSGGTFSSSGFGSFALVLSGTPEQLVEIDEEVLAALSEVEGLANPSSNLADADLILRVDGEPAVRYTAELETEDALGAMADAKARVEAIVPSEITVSEGFETEQQTQGFQQAVQAILISILAVYVVMVITFRSLVYPFAILFSLPVAAIGAIFALWITDRVLGLSALVGMMMLVGIVVTNAIVLIDRVQANRSKRGLRAYGALMEGGRTRLRPILMTATAAIMALLPLAIGFSEGAIVASELGTVVIGGLFTSTLLTLLIVPVMYSLLDKLTKRGRNESN